jgi:NAD(P)H-dependent FMN reductase
MLSSSEYVIVSASLRSESLSRTMAHYLQECYRTEGVYARLIDLRDSPLPFCDGDSAYGHPSIAPISKFISEARVVIAATPIYNFDASAALKNLIELTGDSWENKVVGFLCAAGGSTSFMSIMGFANSLMLDFRCLIIPRVVYAMSSDFMDGRIRSAELHKRIRELAVVSTTTRNGHL